MLQKEQRMSANSGSCDSGVIGTTSKTISDHLTSSVGVCLGLGFGVGLLIGVSLAGSSATSHRDRRHYYQLANDYGHKMFDSIADATPHWLGGRS